MSETVPSVAILERNSSIRPFLKKTADEIAAKSKQSPPMVVLLMHALERPLLKDAINRLNKRIEWGTKKPLQATLFVTDASESTLKALAAHQGPLVIDVDETVFKPKEWNKIEKVLLGDCSYPHLILVSREDPFTLVSEGFLSNHLNKKICRSFYWPGPLMRTPSMKRDYFLSYVASKNIKVHEALANSNEACQLLLSIFEDRRHVFYMMDLLRCVDGYLQHLENFGPEKHPVEMLASFITHVLDEARVSTPPAENEDVNAA